MNPSNNEKTIEAVPCLFTPTGAKNITKEFWKKAENRDFPSRIRQFLPPQANLDKIKNNYKIYQVPKEKKLTPDLLGRLGFHSWGNVIIVDEEGQYRDAVSSAKSRQNFGRSIAATQQSVPQTAHRVSAQAAAGPLLEQVAWQPFQPPDSKIW